MAPFVRGKGFKSAAAFSRTGGKRLILRLPGQLCLIALPDGLVEAGRADRLHRLRAELFPGHEKIEHAELPRMAALLLRKAQQPQQEQELQRLQEVEVLLPDVPATEPLWLHLHEQVQLPEGLLLLVPPTEPEELAQHGLQQEF